MTIVSRIGLFLVTNLAVMLLLGVVTRLFGLDQIMAQSGVPYASLLLMSSLFGFSGSFISLMLSKWMAKRSTGAQVIDTPRNEVEAWLVSTVQRQAQASGIAMPEVAIYDSPTPNAFATGPSRNSALVAVSTGLLRAMNRREVEAVLAHEVSHVANGDMVTLSLIQGVVNTFVIFLSRVIGSVVDKAVFKTERGYGPGYWITVMALEVLFGLLASIVVMWFSRRREFRADAGAAAIEGKQAMISALLRLGQGGESELPAGMKAMGIKGGKAWKLFSTHPSIEDRVMALEKLPG